MTVLKFECRVPIDGYRVLSFDERKWVHWEEDPRYEDFRVYPPDDLTEDEQYLFKKWGMAVVPPPPEVDYIAVKLRHYFEPNSERIRRFDLFEETSMPFLEFANSPDTFEGVKALADRYGPLGIGPETAEGWVQTIKVMQTAVRAWERAKATGDVGRMIRTLATPKGGQYGRHLGGIAAGISLSKDLASGEPRLSIRPTSLLDALWTQLALAIDGSEALQTCVECKKWFTIRAGRGRSDKEYCSNACRMRAYRKRKGAVN